MVRYEDENKTPVTPETIISPHHREDKTERSLDNLAAASGEYDKRWIIGGEVPPGKILQDKSHYRY